MRGRTLEQILNLVRAEARLSLTPANNVQTQDSHIALIQREQERLWEDYAWPHLRVHYLAPLSAGQYLYDLPAETYDASDADAYTLQLDRVEHISVMDGGTWRPLAPEIGEAQYNSFQTVLDQRSWPVRNWQATNGQIEIWPIPDTNAEVSTYDGYLRVTGIRDLQTFVAQSDRADLDDRLIALYVAGGILAAQGAKDAQLKLEAANKLYTKLKGKQTKTTSFRLFGVGGVPRPSKPAITRYVR